MQAPEGIHHAALMFLDKCGYHLPMSGQGADSRIPVPSHQAAIAFHISTEDGRELAFDFLRRRSDQPLMGKISGPQEADFRICWKGT